jgi:hypothetical protein
LTTPELRTVIDLRQSVCVILAAVLHFLPGHHADTIVAAFRHAMAPGSYLILSTGTSTGIDPALISRLQAAYQDSAVVTGRTAGEIAGYFTGLELVPPGLTDVQAWRPDRQRPAPPPRSARILGAVGRPRCRHAGMSDAPAARDDSPAEADDTARWQAAKQLRQDHPGWIVIWLSQIGQYRAYPKFRAPRGTAPTALTTEQLAAQMNQIERTARRPRPR